jgi:hypothetical protein
MLLTYRGQPVLSINNPPFIIHCSSVNNSLFIIHHSSFIKSSNDTSARSCQESPIASMLLFPLTVPPSDVRSRCCSVILIMRKACPASTKRSSSSALDQSLRYAPNRPKFKGQAWSSQRPIYNQLVVDKGQKPWPATVAGILAQSAVKNASRRRTVLWLMAVW